MNVFQLWALPSALAVGVAGMALALWWARRGMAASRNACFEMECTVCQKMLVVDQHEMQALSPPECALVVRNAPRIVGRPLAEYVCPYCESAHCFAMDAPVPEWIASDAYVPQGRGALCKECQKRLQNPAWPPGQYTGKIQDAPLTPDTGMICKRCGAVCCVACIRRATRNRTPDGSYLCPRCARGPLEHEFRF